MSQTPTDTAIAMLTESSGAADGHALEAIRLLGSGDNVVLYGPPGTGKSRAAQQVAAEWVAQYGAASVIQTTFHPSYSYEDFVEGFRPDPDDPTRFVLTDGLLLRASAAATEGHPVLLVIDEINRADVAKVFGELITYIEADKRGIEFTTAQKPDKPRSISKQLYFLGTMNTADKSISLLDVALRRRFRFIECAPDPAAFASSADWKEEAFGINLGDLLDALNERLLGAGVSRDRLVGQALLGLPAGSPDDSALFDRIRYDIYPLVEEYLFGDQIRMESVLPGLVDDHGGMLISGLSVENLRSWLPSPTPTIEQFEEDGDSTSDDESGA